MSEFAPCSHAATIRDVRPLSAHSCLDCQARGDSWVHLRICLVCGYVGCCDNSTNRHARAHFPVTDHSVIQSFEPGESWRYCYADDLMLPAGRPFRPLT